MAPKKREDEDAKERANPIRLFREICKATVELPAELRETVYHLYAFNMSFIEAEQVREGKITFKARPSHKQLAALAGRDTRSIQRRLDRLKGLGIVDWTPDRSHKANEYTVYLSYGVQAPNEDVDNPWLELPLGDGRQGSHTAFRDSHTASIDPHTAFGSPSYGVQAPTLVPIVEPCQACQTQDTPVASLDHFVETRENPGPRTVSSAYQLDDDDELPTPVHTAPPAQQVRRSVAAAPAPAPYYSEEKLQLHKWPADERCSDGSPIGSAACLSCGVKAWEVRRKGICCVSRAFELED